MKWPVSQDNCSSSELGWCCSIFLPMKLGSCLRRQIKHNWFKVELSADGRILITGWLFSVTLSCFNAISYTIAPYLRLVHTVRRETAIRKWNVCAISDFCSHCAMVLDAICNVLTLESHIAITQNGCGTYSYAMSHTSMHRIHMKLHHVNSIIIIHTTYSMR